VGPKLAYPLLHALFKAYILSKRLSLADKVGVLHTADLFLAFWAVHWAFGPLTNVVAANWELAYMLASIAYAASTFLLVVATFLLPAALLPFFRLRTLLLLVPFALNAELAARRELCQWARGSLLRVTLTADGERHSGVVVACNDDAIVLEEEEEEHALPWGQVDSVVAVKEVAEIGREEAKALLARLRRELVRKVGLRAAKRGYIAVVKRAAPHDYIYVYVDSGGCRVAFDGRLPTVAKEAVGRGGFTVECYGKSIRIDAASTTPSDGAMCYKCKTNFDLAIVAQGPYNPIPTGEECMCVRCPTPPKRATAHAAEPRLRWSKRGTPQNIY